MSQLFLLKNDTNGNFFHQHHLLYNHTIFFISDVVPIKEIYIDREYLGFNNIHYVIKNKKLISELERKLKRILYFEDSTPNYFRQHITDLKNKLLIME